MRNNELYWSGLTSSWCVLALFAAREFQACQAIKSKKPVKTGLQVGVPPMESLISHTYHRKIDDF